MTTTRISTVSRRRLLGATLGTGAAAVLGGSTLASPARPGVPMVRRAQEKVTLTLWGQFPEESEAFNAIAADFSATNSNIEIEITMSPVDQYRAKINTALSAGSGPDIFMTSSKPQMDIDVKTGLIMDLTSDVDISSLTDVAKDAVTIEGKVWAVPTGRYTVGICYHRDLFEKAGVAAEPATWEEMRAAMEQLKGANITPYSIAVKDGSLSYFNYIGLASSVLGTEGFNAVLDGTKKLTDADVVVAIQEMRDWIPYYQQNYLGTVYAESKALFAAKQTAMMDCGSADLSGYYQIDPNAQLGFFYWPSPDGVKKQVTNTGMNVIFGFNAVTEHKAEVIAFANWLLTPEGGQSVANHNKVLPVVQGVEPAGDPILTEMVNTPLDVPVWYERWQTLTIGDVWTQEGNAGFDTSTPPEEFAAKLQAAVDKQIATPEA